MALIVQEVTGVRIDWMGGRVVIVDSVIGRGRARTVIGGHGGMRVVFLMEGQGGCLLWVGVLRFFGAIGSCVRPLFSWYQGVRWVGGRRTFRERSSEVGFSCAVWRLGRVGGASFGVAASGMCRMCSRWRWGPGQGRIFLAPERFTAIPELRQKVVSAGNDLFLPPQRMAGAFIHLAIGLPEHGEVVCSCNRLA